MEILLLPKEDCTVQPRNVMSNDELGCLRIFMHYLYWKNISNNSLTFYFNLYIY